MGWPSLIDCFPPTQLAAFALLGVIVGGILTFLGGRYAARVGYMAEAMKLRRSTAERRVKEFEGAAGDLREMMFEIGKLDFDTPAAEAARDRFCGSFPTATLRMLFTAELAMMPAHRDALDPLGADALRSTRELYERLTQEPGSPDAERERRRVAEELANRVALLVHSYMDAVDVSTEAKLAGRSSLRHTDRIGAIVRRWDEQKSGDRVPRPGEET